MSRLDLADLARIVVVEDVVDLHETPGMGEELVPADPRDLLDPVGSLAGHYIGSRDEAMGASKCASYASQREHFRTRMEMEQRLLLHRIDVCRRHLAIVHAEQFAVTMLPNSADASPQRRDPA